VVSAICYRSPIAPSLEDGHGFDTRILTTVLLFKTKWFMPTDCKSIYFAQPKQCQRQSCFDVIADLIQEQTTHSKKLDVELDPKVEHNYIELLNMLSMLSLLAK
jgi:hypothetical protein